MGEVAQFPTIHHYCICPKCDWDYWKILWPKDQVEAWYIECANCGQQYKQGFITGKPTPEIS